MLTRIMSPSLCYCSRADRFCAAPVIRRSGQLSIVSGHHSIDLRHRTRMGGTCIRSHGERSPDRQMVHRRTAPDIMRRRIVSGHRLPVADRFRWE